MKHDRDYGFNKKFDFEITYGIVNCKGRLIYTEGDKNEENAARKGDMFIMNNPICNLKLNCEWTEKEINNWKKTSTPTKISTTKTPQSNNKNKHMIRVTKNKN